MFVATAGANKIMLHQVRTHFPAVASLVGCAQHNTLICYLLPVLNTVCYTIANFFVFFKNNTPLSYCSLLNFVLTLVSGTVVSHLALSLAQAANDGLRGLYMLCFDGPDRGKGFVILSNGARISAADI